MTPQLEKLAALCVSWGGALKELSKDEFDKHRKEIGFAEAPFTVRLGVHWDNKAIVYTGEVAESNVIHEMGHVFATIYPPRASEEFSFFGWEYVVAMRVGIPVQAWLSANTDYVVDGQRDVGCLSDREICTLVHDRVRVARYAGLVRNGRPIAVR